MKTLKNILLICSISSLLWLGVDYTLTSLGLGPWTTNTFTTGVKHDVFHHDLKPNLNNEVAWGDIFYRICTNEYGFKIPCTEAGKTTPKHYDIAFIGDSFTEGVGMPYEDTFVGMYANAHPEQSIVNLGVGSYAPSIYFKKIEYYLKKGFTFKHVIVGIDISDIQDEAIIYTFSEDGSSVITKRAMSVNGQVQEENITNNDQFFTEKHLEYTWYLNLILHKMLFPKVGTQLFDTQEARSAWTHEKNPQGYGIDGAAGGKAQAVASMTKLKKLLDAHNIKMSVLIYPWPAQLIHAPREHGSVKLWKEFCEKEQCASFIDANEAFYNAKEEIGLERVLNENFVRGDFHYNRQGNALVYGEIEKALSGQ